jgi:hypothetical protein
MLVFLLAAALKRAASEAICLVNAAGGRLNEL